MVEIPSSMRPRSSNASHAEHEALLLAPRITCTQEFSLDGSFLFASRRTEHLPQVHALTLELRKLGRQASHHLRLILT